MRKLGHLALLLVVTGAATWPTLTHAASTADPGVTLSYTVRVPSPTDNSVSISARLSGLPAGTDSLACMMQQRFAFVRLPEPLLDGPIRATANGQPLKCDRQDPYQWTIAADGAREIELTYVVPHTHRDIEAVRKRDAYEYPYIAENHGMLVSPTLFVFPEHLDIEHIRVRFELPDGWDVEAPWPRIDKSTFAPPDRASLLNDLIAVGVWHLHKLPVGDFEATIAFAPGQEKLEKAATAPMKSIIAHELELFGTTPAGRYLFLFGRPQTEGLAGSPKTHSMTLSVEPRLAPAAAGHLAHLVAHEFFHTWGSDRIVMPNELRWITEGFTDYYAYLVAARLKLNTWDEFGQTLTRKMTALTSNPTAENLSLVEAGGDVFFENRDAYNLVYDGGLLVAAWLDLKIRAAGNNRSLDDLMRELVNNPRWSRNGPAPTLKDVLDTVARFTDNETADYIDQWVHRKSPPNLPAAFAKVGLNVDATQEQMKLDLRANLDGTRIVNMDHAALAYVIGLRPDDQLTKVNGREVKSTTDVHRAWRSAQNGRVVVEFKRDGKSRSIDKQIPTIARFAVPVDPWRKDQ